MSPLCGAEAKVWSQEAKSVLHKDSQERENTPAQALGGQGMGMVLESEQRSRAEGGPSCRTGRSVGRDSRGVQRSEGHVLESENRLFPGHVL